MSNIYHTEPPTQGKVVIQTSYGDIDIELWPKEAPLACRNFVQLCLEGYYDNTLIHRVIKDFMVQMGDPTNTGDGGESVWGRPFKDEFHGRLKFNHRGQVAMANDNAPHTNLCDWLNQKNTIFGKVTGNTIFNLLRMGETDTDDKDRPTQKIRFIRAEVLWNPFDDIIPRDLSKKTPTAPAVEDSTANRQEKKRNKNLLSFSEDVDECDVAVNVKVKSIHDTAIAPTRLTAETDQELLAAVERSRRETSDRVVENDESTSEKNTKSKSTVNEANDFDAVMREKMLEKRRRLDAGPSRKQDSKKAMESNQSKEEDDAEGFDFQEELQKNMNDKTKAILDEKKREFDKLREDLKKSKRAVKVITGEEAVNAFKNDVTSALEQRRQRFLKRKRDYGERQNETLSRLDEFTSKLREKKSHTTVPEPAPSAAESYHGQILEKEEEEDPKDMEEWHLGKLKFKKHIDDAYRMGGDGKMVDDYAVIDTRYEK